MSYLIDSYTMLRIKYSLRNIKSTSFVLLLCLIYLTECNNIEIEKEDEEDYFNLYIHIL